MKITLSMFVMGAFFGVYVAFAIPRDLNDSAPTLYQEIGVIGVIGMAIFCAFFLPLLIKMANALTEAIEKVDIAEVKQEVKAMEPEKPASYPGWVVLAAGVIGFAMGSE